MTMPRSRARIRAAYRPRAAARGRRARPARLSSPGDRDASPRMPARTARPGRSARSDRSASSAGRSSTASPRWTSPRRSATCPASPLLESARPGPERPLVVPDAPTRSASSRRRRRGPTRSRRRAAPRAGSIRPAVESADEARIAAAAVPRRARRATSATTWATRSSACRDRRRRPGPADPPPRAPRLDARLGPARPGAPGWPVARSTATRPRLDRRLAEVRAPARRRSGAETDRSRRRCPAAGSPSGRASTAPPTTPASRRSGRRSPAATSTRRTSPAASTTAFRGDPWPLYRALRTGDPSLFAAYLDLGPAARAGRAARDGAARAIVSASPEPFLSVDRSGRVEADPIKGTRPRGRTPEEDRALACELLASAKDRAENVMIVDVLRNDLGRVCRPGLGPRPAPVPARADGRRPASRLDGHRSARARSRRVRPARGELPRREHHRRPEDPGDGDPRGARAGPPRPVHGRARSGSGRTARSARRSSSGRSWPTAAG